MKTERGWRFGRRGAFLVSFGVIFAIIGRSYIEGPFTPALLNSLETHTQILPIKTWGWIWCITGGFMMISGVHAFGLTDRFGFATAIIMPAIWTTGYLLTWTFYDPPRVWVSAAIYGAISIAIAIVSGMVDPRDIRVHRE